MASQRKITSCGVQRFASVSNNMLYTAVMHIVDDIMFAGSL